MGELLEPARILLLRPSMPEQFEDTGHWRCARSHGMVGATAYDLYRESQGEGRCVIWMPDWLHPGSRAFKIVLGFKTGVSPERIEMRL